MRDITPKAMRCHVGESCSSIRELDDGRLLIVGLKAGYDMPREAWPDGVNGGFDEAAIIIDRALLANVEREWMPIDMRALSGAWVIASYPGQVCFQIVRWDKNRPESTNWESSDEGYFHADEFTHYMDIPSPPKHLNEKEQG